MRFHGIIVCYDSTDGNSFTQASALYKELLVDPEDSTRLSHYAKIPVAFVATKLDLTDFLRSDAESKPRCIQIPDLRLWLKKVHRRASNACFETSSVENIGIPMMVDWIVREALRVYPDVEREKRRDIERFSGPVEASDENLKAFLASTGNLPEDGEWSDELIARDTAKREERW